MRDKKTNWHSPQFSMGVPVLRIFQQENISLFEAENISEPSIRQRFGIIPVSTTSRLKRARQQCFLIDPFDLKRLQSVPSKVHRLHAPNPPLPKRALAFHPNRSSTSRQILGPHCQKQVPTCQRVSGRNNVEIQLLQQSVAAMIQFATVDSIKRTLAGNVLINRQFFIQTRRLKHDPNLFSYSQWMSAALETTD